MLGACAGQVRLEVAVAQLGPARRRVHMALHSIGIGLAGKCAACARACVCTLMSSFAVGLLRPCVALCFFGRLCK